MTRLQEEIDRALKGTTIVELATRWNIPRFVIDDLRRSHTKLPGAPYLLAIARGLGRPVEELIAPPEESQRTPRNGRRRGKATVSTS